MIDLSNCPKNQPAKFFEPDGTLITETDDERVFNYIRCCIKKEQLKGYYIEFNGQRINLDRNGTPSDFPNGFFDANVTLLFELI